MAGTKAIIAIEEGMQVELANRTLTVKGPNGELRRPLPLHHLTVTKEENNVVFTTDKSQYKAIVGSYAAHFKNMMAGLKEPYTYKCKICASHFPMSAKLQGNELIVQNFLGGKSPIKIRFPAAAKVQLNGDEIIIKSADIEAAGKTASLFEQKVKAKGKDRRIFQDGIYITEKAGEKI